MKTILTPIDFSPATMNVIAASVDLAAAIKGEVVLLHVVQAPMVTSDYGLAMENVQEILEVSEKAASRQLSHLGEKFGNKGVAVRTDQTSAPAVSGILQKAEEIGASYIVMGSHGHTALYDLLVGTTTHGVLKKAQCPVLIVPSAKE